MAHAAQMLTQEPIYKPSSIFCFKSILLSAHKLIMLIYGDNNLKHMNRKPPTNPPKPARLQNSLENKLYLSLTRIL